MEQLQILKFSIKKGSGTGILQKEGTGKDELQALEYLARTDPAGEPESYWRNLERAQWGQ